MASIYDHHIFKDPGLVHDDTRMASLETHFHWLKRGVIMQLHFDLETGGIDHMDRPHSARGYSAITEYGDALADISGNYLNSINVEPRRPEWTMVEAAPPYVQRTENGAWDYDSPERMPFMQAMAMLAWRFDTAATKFDELGGERQQVTFDDINLQARGPKECTETTIPIYMKDKHGMAVIAARYHPDRNMVAWRVDLDPEGPEDAKNLCYIDRSDNSKWRWVAPRLKVSGFNVKPFDIMVLRTNMARAGMHPKNIPYAYSQATITNKQGPKNYLCDERDTCLAVALHGRHGEDGLKLGEKVNPVTGRPFLSEAQALYLENNTKFQNMIRLLEGGAFMPDDGSVHDSANDHGAYYDAKGSLALSNLVNDISADIVSEVEKQSDEEHCRLTLSALDPHGKKLPLFSLPRRDFPEEQTDSLYLFLDTDDQMGRFKKYVFIHTDGNLRNARYNDKPLHKLTTDEWIDYFTKAVRHPDRPIRVESFRRWRGALSLETVLQKSHQAGRYRDMLDEVDQDVIYLQEHAEMLEDIRAALEEINRRQRFEPGPHNPLMEDQWPHQGFGDILYLDDEIKEERRHRARESKTNRRGPQHIPGILETIKNRAQDDYNFLNMVDEAMMRLCVTAHAIDYVDENAPEGQEVLDNFRDLAKRVRQKFRDKNVPHLKFIEPYFVDGKPKFTTIAQARKFRDDLGIKALKDYAAETQKKNSSYAKGFVETGHLFPRPGQKDRMLFASPNRGERGGTPHLVDEAGRELPVEYLKKQKPREVIKMLSRGKWSFRFYRLESEPIIETLLFRFADAGRLDKLPPEWKARYEARVQLRLWGAPNEEATTERFPTIRGFEFDQKRIKINAKKRDNRLLEREPRSQAGQAAELLKHDEGQRIAAANDEWVEHIKKTHPYRTDLVASTLYDPESGLPYDYIPYEIASEDFVLIDVPAWHLRHPIRQFDLRLPHNCLVLPRLGDADWKKLKRGAPVVLREKETGRLYHPGPVSFHFPPKKQDKSFSRLNENAHKAYDMAGVPFPEDKDRFVLGIEDLYPIANSRDIKATHQTLKVPTLQFDGLTYPEISTFQTGPLTSLILPVDYCPQELIPNAKMRLREMGGQMFDNVYGKQNPDTGHVYETRLRTALGVDENGKKTGITLGRFFDDAQSGKISPEFLEGCGFLGKDDMEAKLRKWAAHRWSADPMQERILGLDFDRVRTQSWAYFNPPVAPEAAFTKDGRPVPPSAYQDYWKQKKPEAA